MALSVKTLQSAEDLVARMLCRVRKSVVLETVSVDRNFRSSFAPYSYLRHNDVDKHRVRLHFWVAHHPLTNGIQSRFDSFLTPSNPNRLR